MAIEIAPIAPISPIIPITALDFNGRNIWTYWPEEGVSLIEENEKKGIISCHLPEGSEVGDIRHATIVKDILGIDLRHADDPVQLCNIMRKGDYVIACKDSGNIVGVGVVIGDYYFDYGKLTFRHCRKVQWVSTDVLPYPEEFKRTSKRDRLVQCRKHYRDLAEQLITQLCEGREFPDPKTYDDVHDDDVVVIDGYESDVKAEDIHAESSLADIHADFKEMARRYQEKVIREWAKDLGNACIWDETPGRGACLKEEYALKGLLFYKGFRAEVMKLYRAGKTKLDMRALKSALRCEHTAYNMFYPMMLPQNRKAATAFFNELMGTEDIAEVLDIIMEYAPQPPSEYLNDITAFDVCVFYRHTDGSKGAIGIEIKYIEREYSIKEQEYDDTHDDQGYVSLSEHYLKATTQSGYYRLFNEEALVTDLLRQLWRNHILGASMVQHGDIDHFDSIKIFPEANPHFHAATEKYREMLTDKGNASFHTFSYEKVFETLPHHFNSESDLKWIKYLYHRYLFGAEMPPVTKGEAAVNVDDAWDENFEETQLAPQIADATAQAARTGFPIAKNRVVPTALIEAFRSSILYTLWRTHRDEILVCVRNNRIILYYRMYKIAVVSLLDRGVIACDISSYLLGHEGRSSHVRLSGDDIKRHIFERYDKIKNLIERRMDRTNEKAIQQMLVQKNNSNRNSKWFCVDVNWACSFTDNHGNKAGIDTRIDIIAVSKTAPHRVAVIELKHGSGSLDQYAGVIEHIEDFKTLKYGGELNGTHIDYYEALRTDICNIIQAYDCMGCELPSLLRQIDKDSFAGSPEFYFLTFDNRTAETRKYTPKQALAAYLFSPGSDNFNEWGGKHSADKNVQDDMGINVLDANSEVPVTFLFSVQNRSDISKIDITDILEDPRHETIRPVYIDEQKKRKTKKNALVYIAVVAVVALVVWLLLWLVSH